MSKPVTVFDLGLRAMITLRESIKQGQRAREQGRVRMQERLTGRTTSHQDGEEGLQPMNREHAVDIEKSQMVFHTISLSYNSCRASCRYRYRMLLAIAGGVYCAAAFSGPSPPGIS